LRSQLATLGMTQAYSSDIFSSVELPTAQSVKSSTMPMSPSIALIIPSSRSALKRMYSIGEGGDPWGRPYCGMSTALEQKSSNAIDGPQLLQKL
jgi:hypothetical protein